MTAPELHAIVQHWPREAWPKDIDIRYINATSDDNGHHQWFNGIEGQHLADAHAIILFEASGLRWLADERQCCIEIKAPCIDSADWWVVVGPHFYAAPTLIEALSAAIKRATQLKEPRP